MVIGRTGSGKTTFAIQAGANIIKPFSDAVMFYDDIEGGSNEVRREILTQFSPLEIKKRVIYRNSAISAENFYKRIQELYDEKLSHRDDYEYNTGKLDSGGNEIYKLAGEEFNIDSPQQLGEVLFEKLQIPSGKKTKTGYSTNVEVLEMIANNGELAEDNTYYWYCCIRSFHSEWHQSWYCQATHRKGTTA